MATFGKTTDGTGASTSTSSRVFCSTATPASSGTVTGGAARISLSASGSVAARMAIYSDSSGSPGALLASSDLLTVTATSEAEHVFTFSAGNQISITAGTPYWIGVGWAAPGNPPGMTVSRDGTAGGRYEQTISSWPTLPNPFGTPVANNTGPIDAYITYTVSGGGSTTQPVVRAASAASGASAGTAAVVTKPAGLAVGDLMLAWQVGDNDASLSGMTGPAWELIASQGPAAGGHPAMKVYRQVATVTETGATSFSFGTDAGVFCSAGIVALQVGTFDSSNPLAAAVTFTTNDSSTTAHDAPSVAGVVNGLLITAHATDQGGAATCSYTPPSGMTEQLDTAAASGYTGLEVATLALASSVATGVKTATCTASRPSTGASLIVNPAAAAGNTIAQRTGGFLALL